MPQTEHRTAFEATIDRPRPGRWGASFLIRRQREPEQGGHDPRLFTSEAEAEAWIWSVATALGYRSITLRRLAGPEA